jgi:hypothetical protein
MLVVPVLFFKKARTSSYKWGLDSGELKSAERTTVKSSKTKVMFLCPRRRNVYTTYREDIVS